MFDFLRNLTKSAEEKHQERVHAYLDEALTPRQRQQFEQDMAQDSGLQAEIDHLRLLKQQLRQLPRRPVPRSFTLDPALYGRPARQPLFQFYPVLQGATVLTALFFMLALSLSLFSQPETASPSVASAPQAAEVPEAETAEEPMREEPAAELFAEDSAAEKAASAPAIADEAVELTRVIIEEVIVEAEEVAEEETIEEEAPAEETAGEAALSEGSLPQPTTLSPVAEAATPLPTATVSQLPRSSATQTAAVRLQTQATAAADDQDTTTDTTADNAVGQPSPLEPTHTPPSPEATTVSPLNLAQIGLGILLIIFGGLTYFVRRRL